MNKHSERTDSRRKPKHLRLELRRRRIRDDERLTYEPKPEHFRQPPMYLN